ncbi:hypothetical protein BC833DRAFT_521469 [Globomyces pollinis-pini]|nr:hypothetical protein BC833DRAFT_521469 [Globomyces pollinis-pini]
MNRNKSVLAISKNLYDAKSFEFIVLDSCVELSPQLQKIPLVYNDLLVDSSDEVSNWRLKKVFINENLTLISSADEVLDVLSTTKKIKRPRKSISKKQINWIKSVAGIKSKPKPIFNENSLSINERYFHRESTDTSQVVMVVGMKVSLPISVNHISENRIIDLVKLTASQMYRTSCIIDYDSQNLIPMGKFASDIRVKCDFVEYLDDQTALKTAQEAINHRFDMKDQVYPCWKVAIIGPKEMKGDGVSLTEYSNESLRNFYVLFSFHHCLGDGLSVFSFSKSFFNNLTPQNLNSTTIDLHKVPITKSLPPLLDNYIYTNLIGIMPVEQQFKRVACQSKLKNLVYLGDYDPLLKLKSQAHYSLLSHFPFTQNLASDQQNVANNVILTEDIQVRYTKNRSLTLDKKTFSEKKNSMIPKTGVRWLQLDQSFSSKMLENTRFHNTSLSAVIIVAALSAVRSVFIPRAVKRNLIMPEYQSWVCTTSMRHLIPNSKLLEGSDKETDPSIREFGCYAGSVSNEKLKFNEFSELWERAKLVRKQISGQFFRSMRRLKLLNYTYRKPTLWNAIRQKVDLNELTRSYSVEVANLGSWKALENQTRSNDKIKMDWFGGTQNNSFKGARAIFSVSVISIADVLSFSVSYDMSAITEDEADLFIQQFKSVLDKMKDSNQPILVKSLQ